MIIAGFSGVIEELTGQFYYRLNLQMKFLF